MRPLPTDLSKLVPLLLVSITVGCQPPAAPGASAPTPADGGPAAEPGPTPVSPPAVVGSVPADADQGVAVAADVLIQFSRAMDPTSTSAAITFVPHVDCTGSFEGATYRCKHAPLSPSTSYAVIVHEGAKDTSGNALDGEYSFTFTTAAAVITSVTIEGWPDNEVRQGAGEVTLTATGSGLSGITMAELDTLQGTVDSATDTQVVVKTVVPHGQKPGSFPLALTGLSGSAVSPAALVVTEIQSAAGQGNDAGAGTNSAPFATLSKALSVARAGDTIKLADGMYSAGETWAQSTPNVPAGVAIEGTSLTGTVLMPAGGAAASATALSFAGDATVTNLQIHGFARGALANLAGCVTFGTVRIWGNSGDGIALAGTAMALSQALEVDSNGAAGVTVDGSAYFSAIYGNVHDNGAGVRAAWASKIELMATSVTHNGHTAASSDSGIFLVEQASAKVSGDISGNAASGIYSASTGSLQIAGTVNQNGTAAGCSGNYLCSGVVLAAAGHVSSQGHMNDNAVYGIVTHGKHATVELTGATLSGNGVANAVFDDADTSTGCTTVTLYDTTLSNSSTGISWSDRVKLTMTGGSMSNHALVDLFNGTTMLGWPNSFTNVRFGPSQIYYPAKYFTYLGSTAYNAAQAYPSWTIVNPAATGGPATISFTHQW